MAIVRIARHAAHAHHQALPVRGGDRHLHAKFIRLPCLAFGDALGLGRMQAVELVLVALFLREQALGFGQQVSGLVLQGARYILALACHIAPDTAHHGLEFLQARAHALVLFGVRVTAHLNGQLGCFAVVVLAQRQSRFGGQLDQMLPGPLQQFAVGRISDGLFLHGAVDDDFLIALRLDDLG